MTILRKYFNSCVLLIVNYATGCNIMSSILVVMCVRVCVCGGVCVCVCVSSASIWWNSVSPGDKVITWSVTFLF